MQLNKSYSSLYTAESGSETPLPLAVELEKLKSKACIDQRSVFIAVGHDACQMIEVALGIFGKVSPEDAIAVTSHDRFRMIDGCQVLAASHPIPNSEGLNAAERVSDKLDSCGVGTHVVALISDGASALLPSPVAGITLGDKIEVNDLLLNSKLEIHQVNIVRQSLSTLGSGLITRI
ncbi:DUF4147 domain-containing protein [Roseovarius aestuarii]|nr:DUF4147 domain-containing protein [Roseovarius aestuarii]